jgi:hypothetical protein
MAVYLKRIDRGWHGEFEYEEESLTKFENYKDLWAFVRQHRPYETKIHIVEIVDE